MVSVAGKELKLALVPLGIVVHHPVVKKFAAELVAGRDKVFATQVVEIGVADDLFGQGGGLLGYFGSHYKVEHIVLFFFAEVEVSRVGKKDAATGFFVLAVLLQVAGIVIEGCQAKQEAQALIGEAFGIGNAFALFQHIQGMVQRVVGQGGWEAPELLANPAFNRIEFNFEHTGSGLVGKSLLR